MNTNTDLSNAIGRYMADVGQQARAASRIVGRAETRSKDAALVAIADALEAAEDDLCAANRLDMDAGQAAGLAPALLDRLELTAKGVRAMAQG